MRGKSEVAAMYKTMFKCRLCGAIYAPGGTSSENTAMKAAIESALGVPPTEPQTPHLTEMHSCINGSFGIADFLGFLKESEEKKID